ncbi:MAG: indole-3-glycerol phosphate synthase TrpC [Ignavibacteriaceae bacterium]
MNILEQIVEVKKEEVKKLKQKYSLNSFKEMEFFGSKSLEFSGRARSNQNISIISEIKKASPSKGIIREDFNHLKIAEIYFKCGTDAVSILTDEKFFKGNIEFLKDIASIKETPLLRKDFIIDEFQVFQSKGNGADIILLISEILSKSQINELSHAAKEAGLEVLLELHSEKQLNKIDFGINKILGVNNRNLEDFSIDLNTTLNLSRLIPDDIILVAESGIKKKEDINYLSQADIDAILVGEHLMTAKSIEEKFTELKNWCNVTEKANEN